jgi:hypothetical protein
MFRVAQAGRLTAEGVHSNRYQLRGVLQKETEIRKFSFPRKVSSAESLARLERCRSDERGNPEMCSDRLRSRTDIFDHDDKSPSCHPMR